eukprot:scaffold31084_cov90-Isochrysis_galbana.AAC.1
MAVKCRQPRCRRRRGARRRRRQDAPASPPRPGVMARLQQRRMLVSGGSRSPAQVPRPLEPHALVLPAAQPRSPLAPPAAMGPQAPPLRR